jgi:hypothetical protein
MPAASSVLAIPSTTFARLAIDDARLAVVLGLDERSRLARRVTSHDGVADVGLRSKLLTNARASSGEPLDHVLARQVVGRRRQRHARHVGKGFRAAGRTAVFGRK